MGVPISNVTRRVVFAASGTGPYSFTFEILANTDIAVYKDDALLTLTTDYTVTINANGTGSITLTASPTGATQIAIVGNRTISRTTDFVTGGDFFANTVNDELDQQTIFNQQNAEGLGRALQAPQTDPTTIDMTLPRASVRAGKVLAFDSNGDPTTGEVIGDFRGNWASGTAYNKRDIVKDTSNGNIYYCTVAHTSSGAQPISTNADSAKWTLVIDVEAANDAQAAAEAAQAAAEVAQAAAETAETNAETAETNAETAATNAASSASSASTSATNAASSASTASTAATNAGNSATAAASSASSASSSASSASTSASNASSSASSASTSASNASTSATNAASSASSASSSASTATTQATNASNSASAAATSATNASNSASAASTSASNASTSETNAAASAASAASALDSFDDRYLGSKSSDPTVDNDGNALLTGALYYNTTTQTMKVYDGANWITATAAGTTAMLVYKYVATNGQTTFSGAASVGGTLSYTSGNIIVFVNGVSLDSTDYTATNGTSVVLGAGAALNDEVVIIAFKSFTVADTYTKGEVDAFAVKLTGDQTVAGVKTFSSKAVIEGLTVGKGAGAVSTNTAVGASALAANTTGLGNSVFGAQSAASNSTGNYVTSLGYQAGQNNTASYNLFVGAQAGQSNTSGASNSFVGGMDASGNPPGYQNTTGSYNIALGGGALKSNTTASYNTAVGYQSGYNNTTGQENTYLGNTAGRSNTTGTGNTLLGLYAGYGVDASYNTFIGNNSGYLVTSGSKNTILGRYNGNQGGLDIRTASNYIVLSDGDGNPRLISNGSGLWGLGCNPGAIGGDLDIIGNQNGLGVGYSTSIYRRMVVLSSGGTSFISASNTASLNSAGAWTNASDARLKKNITDINYGLNTVVATQPRSYERNDVEGKFIGFIAQELKDQIPEVVFGGEDEQYTVDYGSLVAVAFKAIQELKAEFDAYKEAHP